LVAVRRFPTMGVVDSRPLCFDSYVRMQHFVRRSFRTFPFDGFSGMCGEISCNFFLLIVMVLWVLIFAGLCKRVVLMLWYAYLFLGLRIVGFSPPFSRFCLVISTFFSFKKCF
jgi:hypothetical protein